MKRYLAIGHWTDNKNMVSIACTGTSIKNFRETLAGNCFVPYAIVTETKLEVLRTVSDMDLFDEVKKLTTNYRVWNDLCDYIEQCLDIMEEKMANA